MKSALLALGLATAFLASAAHSSPLTASSGSTHFASASADVQVSARKGKAAKHAKAKRHHRAVKKA